LSQSFCRCAISISTSLIRTGTITLIIRGRGLDLHKVQAYLTRIQQKMLPLQQCNQLLHNKVKHWINSPHRSCSRSQIQMTRFKVFQVACPIKLPDLQHPFHKGHLGVCGVSSQSCKALSILCENNIHSFRYNSIYHTTDILYYMFWHLIIRCTWLSYGTRTIIDICNVQFTYNSNVYHFWLILSALCE
jgi:hypothetical protein